MLGLIKKMFSKKDVEVKNFKRFDGKTYRGVWRIGDDIVIGAYIRDGQNTIVTEKGIYLIPDGTKKVQLEKVDEIKNDKWIINGEEVNADTGNIEHYLKCVCNNWCLPLIAKL